MQPARDGTFANRPRPRRIREDTRLSETSPDAKANGRERTLHQAWSNSAGHFVVQRLRVSSGENMLLQPLQRKNYRLAVS